MGPKWDGPEMGRLGPKWDGPQMGRAPNGRASNGRPEMVRPEMAGPEMGYTPSGKRNASSQALLASSLKRRIKESLALRATAFAVVEADLQEAAVASGAVSSTLLPR